MHALRSFLRHFLRLIIAAAAAANLIVLFLFSYHLPESVTRRLEPLGINLNITRERTAAVTEAPAGEEGESEEEVREISVSADGTRLMVPSQAINYNGGDLDLLSGIYIQNADGSRVEDAEIKVDISDGATRLDKVARYTTVLEDGTELTGRRAIRLGSRYTGPSIMVTGEIPEVSAEDNLKKVVKEQIKEGNVYAEDGFGVDITKKVKARFDKTPGEEEGEEILTLVFYVKNGVGDKAEMAVQDDMLSTGVVMRLTTEDLTLNVGTPFYYQDFVAESHDAHGNWLAPHVSGVVNSYVCGEYEIEVWCVDDNGVSSPVRTMKVHVI